MSEKKIKILTKPLCLFISGLFFSVNANAIIILQNASVSSGIDFDNNVNMSNNPQSVWRYSLVPSYSISGINELNRWFSSLSLNIQRSSDKNLSIDREDPSLALGWSKEFERGNLTLNGSYVRASTRVTQLQESGLVANDASSISKSISINFTRILTERLNWSLGGALTKSTFTGGSGFTGFNSKSLTSTLNYDYSEKLRPFVNLGYSTYDSAESPQNIQNTQNSQNSQTFTIGTIYNINPRLVSNFSAGYTKLSTGVGKVGNINLSYSGDNYQFTSAYSRSVTPSSIGGFQNADSISLSYSYSLSERDSLGAGFNWRKNNSLNDIESKQITAFYSRILTEFWQMRLSLQARDIKSIEQSANGEMLGISLIYNTPNF